MRYVLHWTCKTCGRKQSTPVETGQAWPTICAECAAPPRKGSKR